MSLDERRTLGKVKHEELQALQHMMAGTLRRKRLTFKVISSSCLRSFGP